MQPFRSSSSSFDWRLTKRLTCRALYYHCISAAQNGFNWLFHPYFLRPHLGAAWSSRSSRPGISSGTLSEQGWPQFNGGSEVADENWHSRKILLDFLLEVQEDPADRWSHGDPSDLSLQTHPPPPYLHVVLGVPRVKFYQLMKFKSTWVAL